MTIGYVLEAGNQSAITKEANGSNLPSPKQGSWKFVKKVDDVNKAGLIAFDPAVFANQGYQIYPAPAGGFLMEQDILSDKNVLK
jgi:hypothetical protein